MSGTEAITFSCEDLMLYGILDLPRQAAHRGILIVVGGPQYRVGSHRQFTLLARELAAQGFPAMRFDHRGIGDSDGECVPFHALDPDIRAAIDAFCSASPGIKEVVIWGLCDAASAAMIYAAEDPRVSGLVLLNPWVRTEQGLARTYLTRYYGAQFCSKDFWARLVSGKVALGASLKSLFASMWTALNSRPRMHLDAGSGSGSVPGKSFQQRMKKGLQAFRGSVLIILSGEDLTANEFESMVYRDHDWRRALDNDAVEVRRIENADHTFSRRIWSEQVTEWTFEWLRSW